MRTQPLTLADIQTTDLIYYDPEFDQQCRDFCRFRDIDCLPSLTNPRKFYQPTNIGFKEMEAPEGMLVDSQTVIFDPTLPEKFERYKVLFVIERDCLSGVVHFSDYNNTNVQNYLFTVIAQYERSMRWLLKKKNLKNNHMLGYFEKMSNTTEGELHKRYCDKLQNYQSFRKSNEKLGHFECFYLSDLIELAVDHNIIRLNSDVSRLRNQIMHANDLVSFKDPHAGDFVYKIDSFKTFFRRATALLDDFKRVENRVALEKMSEA